MSLNLFANPVINRTGSIPGFWQGLLADRGDGYAPGDLFLADDAQELFKWEEVTPGSGTFHWVLVLAGGGGTGNISGTLTPTYVPYANGIHSLNDSKLLVVTNFGDMSLEGSLIIGPAGGGPPVPINGAAIFELQSTAKGILIPRMTQAQRTGITTGAAQAGLLVYCTNASSPIVPAGFWYWDGAAWTYLNPTGATGPTGPTGPTGATGATGGTTMTVGTTDILSGTANRVLYENAANKLAESSDITFDGTTFATLHLAGTSAAPGITAGAGAGGAGVSVAIDGDDMGGTITVTPGAAPTAGTTIVTITFVTAYAAAPRVIQLTPRNVASASLLVVNQPFVPVTTLANSFVVSNKGAGVLVAGTTYIWDYFVKQ